MQLLGCYILKVTVESRHFISFSHFLISLRSLFGIFYSCAQNDSVNSLRGIKITVNIPFKHVPNLILQ